jgi:amino-acid N-acetyltransferase
MASHPIHPQPSRRAAVALLEAAGLPVADLTDAHMQHFFYCGPTSALTGLVGVEFRGGDALLRSLAVLPDRRSTGLGAALVAHAEGHARSRGARSIFLLTTTAEEYFRRHGYRSISRDEAPSEIRSTREFADICPASSAFMVKTL